MINAYKIGVSIALTNNMSGILKVIQRDVMGLKKQVDMVGGGFNRARVAALGFAGVIGGAAMLGGMEKLVKAGDQLVEQQVKLRALGVAPGMIGVATGAAYGMAQTIPGSAPAHNLQTIRELRAVLKNTSEAIAGAPAALRAELVMSQFGNGSAGSDQSMLMILKAMDIKGAFVKNGQLNVGAFNAAMNEAETALSLTNGILTPNMFYRFTRMAGPAASAMNTSQYLKDFTEVMLGLGPTGGRGMEMAAKTLLGGQITQANAQQLEGLGLVLSSGIKKYHGSYAIKTGALKGYHELLTKGFVQWFNDVVKPAMTAHHMTGKTAVLQALSSLPVTEQRLFSFIYTNMAQIQKFGDQYDKALPIDKYKVLQNGSLNLNIKDLTSAWDGLMQAMGAPLVKPAIAALKDVTAGLLWLEAAAVAHPEATKIIGEIGVGLGAIGVVLGTFAIGSAAAGALLMLGGPAGLAAAAAGLVALSGGVHALLESYGDKLEMWITGRTPAQQEAYNKKIKQMNADGEKATHDAVVGLWRWFDDGLNWVNHDHKGGNLNNYLPDGTKGAIHHDSYVPPHSGGPRIQTIVYTQLNGKTIATTVSEEQARHMALPQSGPSRFDGRMTPSFPGNTLRI